MFYDESMSEIPEPIVMEDGAPVHKGASNNPQEDLKQTTYLHLPNSPDPIENIWAWIKHEINTNLKYMYITSKPEMQRIAMEMWENFRDDKWNRIIESMPARMKTVIKAKGGPT